MVLVISDLILLSLAFKLAYMIRFEASLGLFQIDSLSSPAYYDSLTLVLVILWMISFALSGLYNRKNLLGGVEEYSLLFRSTLGALLVLIFGSFILPEFIIAAGLVVAGMVFLVLVSGTWAFQPAPGHLSIPPFGVFYVAGVDHWCE